MDVSSAGLFASLFIGALGAGLLIFGWKQKRLPQTVGGILLSVYPYFIPNVWVMIGIAVVVCAGVWIAIRAGA